jgi:hypothetical protein
MSEELFSAGDVRDLIRDEIANWGTQKMVAKRIGISPTFLSDVLLLRRDPGPKVAEYFDLEPVTLYRPRSTQRN